MQCSDLSYGKLATISMIYIEHIFYHDLLRLLELWTWPIRVYGNEQFKDYGYEQFGDYGNEQFRDYCYGPLVICKWTIQIMEMNDIEIMEMSNSEVLEINNSAYMEMSN